jgi:hypothetical protein
MTVRCWVLSFLAASLLLTSVLACSTDGQDQSTPGLPATTMLIPTLSPTSRSATAVPATAMATPVSLTATSAAAPPTLTATMPASGLTQVRFALDVDETGQLIFPATEFVFGVTRIYVRFSYRGLGNLTQVKTNWYLNENLVSSGTLDWDGGEAGDYVIWVEDAEGLGRGHWEWELVAIGRTGGREDDTRLGRGAFTVGGEPSFVNETWGLSFDPPGTWEVTSERADFVAFSSPDQRQALALRAIPQAGSLPEVSSAELALFREDHPEAEVVMTGDITMSGEAALLQQVRYEDQEVGEQFLFIVSALHDGASYSLWVLGPADDVATLKRLLVVTLRSIQFMAGE